MAISDEKHEELELIEQDGEYYSLHTHSEYSYKDALAKPSDIAKRSIELGNDAFCITDHGHLGCLIQGFMAQKEHKIQFIPGMEIYLIPESRYWALNKKKREESGEEIEDFAVRYYHLTLIAKNQTGLQNLIKIYNRKEMHYDRECISRETLFKHSEGIIVLSGCIAGETIYFIKNGMDDKAKEILNMYKEHFGDDFYAEIQYHGLHLEEMSENEIYCKLIDMARELDIELVPTTDSHYVYPEEKENHNIYKSIHYDGKDSEKFKYDFENQRFNDVFDGDGYHIMSADEIRAKLRNIDALTDEDIEHMLKNTLRIRRKCEVCAFPEALPLQDKSAELRELVEKGWEERRKGTDREQESKERYEYELSVIEGLGFTEYFINVRDIVNRAKELGVLPGPGRGCFLPGNNRVTLLKDGDLSYPLIEDVKDLCMTNDLKALTRTGIFEQVSNVFEYDVVDEDCIELELENGIKITCTSDHKFLTENRGWVEAKELTEEDDLVDIK